ncbi:hypothetical protein EDB81DRAFT_494633 [Dactylonectria macrodidyma]|uniref:Uncharacterized protein n=1 Tax=Dactylonectria macrodidyma TaxID=307937 RepID=A0A9P9J6L7_9HYPO|nr:hypothetical protein EDB81DRAFT_494633 [Dactylonectria macrodidyma]
MSFMKESWSRIRSPHSLPFYILSAGQFLQVCTPSPHGHGLLRSTLISARVVATVPFWPFPSSLSLFVLCRSLLPLGHGGRTSGRRPGMSLVSSGQESANRPLTQSELGRPATKPLNPASSPRPLRPAEGRWVRLARHLRIRTRKTRGKVRRICRPCSDKQGINAVTGHNDLQWLLRPNGRPSHSGIERVLRPRKQKSHGNMEPYCLRPDRLSIYRPIDAFRSSSLRESRLNDAC